MFGVGQSPGVHVLTVPSMRRQALPSTTPKEVRRLWRGREMKRKGEVDMGEMEEAIQRGRERERMRQTQNVMVDGLSIRGPHGVPPQS